MENIEVICSELLSANILSKRVIASLSILIAQCTAN